MIRSVRCFDLVNKPTNQQKRRIIVKRLQSWIKPSTRTRPWTTAYGIYLPYGITQCYLPPTQVNAPRLNPSRKAGTRFTYPGGMEGWVTRQSTDQESNLRSSDHKSDALTTTLPSHSTSWQSRSGDKKERMLEVVRWTTAELNWVDESTTAVDWKTH